MASPGEYFGDFLSEPSLKVKNNDEGRPTFILLDTFLFKDPNGFEWSTPKGWEVDGASIPKFAWSIVGGPLSGKYLHASIIHDRYCDTKERTAHDTHRNFYYGMKANGVSDIKANIMYWAVRTFGPSWKVVKQPLFYGLTGPTKYTLAKVDLSAPNIPQEKIDELMRKISSDLTMTQLDELSDSARNKYGSEELQQVEPILSPKKQE